MLKTIINDILKYINDSPNGEINIYSNYDNIPKGIIDDDLFRKIYTSTTDELKEIEQSIALKLEKRFKIKLSHMDARWFAERIQIPITFLWGDYTYNTLEELMNSLDFDPLSILSNKKHKFHTQLKYRLDKSSIPLSSQSLAFSGSYIPDNTKISSMGNYAYQ